MAILVVAGVGLALVKPWGWGASKATPPVDVASPSGPLGGEVTAAPTAPSAGHGAGFDCLSDDLWTAVVDEVDADGQTLARSWIRIDPVAARGPDDPAIAKVRVFAEGVPRIGYCAPVRGARGDLDRPIEVTAWWLEQNAAPGGEAPIQLAVVAVAGGTVRDGGALYAPPLDVADDLPTGAAGDPEAAWAVDAPSWRPGRWSTGPPPSVAWPPGTYVLAVESPGPTGVGTSWFAVELRGPWRGPEAAQPVPAPGSRAPGVPATPGPSPVPGG